jgi:Dolichyl-phosphate-mannose-protein mannosyltransferase
MDAKTNKDMGDVVALKEPRRFVGRRSTTFGGMLRPEANRSGIQSEAAVVHSAKEVPGGESANEVPVTRERAIDTGVLALAVVVGTVLRVVGLGAVGLNSDEAVYAGQAASLVGNPNFTDNFPVIRAHPLLFQLIVSPLYRTGIPEVPGRYVNAFFGVGTIVLVFQLGRLLYGRRVGALAGLLLAVMPYHVIITRQVLLDGPMTFFATGALVCLAALARTGRSSWLVAAGGCLGIASLTKETAVILIVSAFIFLSLVPRFWRPVRYLVAGAAAALVLALTYPVVTAVSGGGRSGQSYLLWQLSRRPNHDFLFYFTVVPAAMGVLLLASAAVGLVVLRHRSSWREVLLLAWIVVPFVFFEVWPVKGFPYLVLLAPAIVVLAARTVVALIDLKPRTLLTVGLGVVAGAALVLSMLVPSLRAVLAPSGSGLAGAGGSPGGREAGLWVEAHLPEGARLLTLGPSMGNVLEYYSGRRADGLSVSPNPLHRNPSYLPIPNPDAALRSGDYQYVVWDAYSAKRSPTFAAKELNLIGKYGGRVVHTELATLGGQAMQPVVVIYEVQP